VSNSQQRYEERAATRHRESSARFEVIENALKDVAEQLVMMARGI
jgi:hypothetical protein